MSHTSMVSPELRRSFRARVEPMARMFGRLGLSPNALTVIGFAISAVAGVVAANQAWLAAGLLVVFGAIFDLFDGALARATGRTSRLGAFLDSTLDRAAEAVVYLGVLVGLENAGYVGGSLIAAAAMAASFMVSYTRAKSESLGFTPGTGMANIGLAPREVRIVILTAGLVVAGLLPAGIPSGGAGGAAFPPWWLVLVGSLALITILATITTIQRIVHVMRQAGEQEQHTK